MYIDFLRIFLSLTGIGPAKPKQRTRRLSGDCDVEGLWIYRWTEKVGLLIVG